MNGTNIYLHFSQNKYIFITFFHTRIASRLLYQMIHFTFRLTNEIAETIGNMIVAEFPSEVASTYYIPPIKKKDSIFKKSIPARGKIISMWRNRTYQNRKLDYVTKKRESEPSTSNGKAFY